VRSQEVPSDITTVMKVIATVSDMRCIAIVFNLESGLEQLIPMRPEFNDLSLKRVDSCNPFGITWFSEQIFIANNRQILVFDKKFNYVRTLTTLLQGNTHQLSYHEGMIWAVSPWRNSLIAIPGESNIRCVEFDLLRKEAIEYCPIGGSESDDQYHFNSLLWTDTQLFVTAHAFGKESFIYCFDAATLCLQSVLHNVGRSIHSVALHDGELFWIDTNEGMIRSTLGFRHQLSKSGFARGLCVTRDYFVVGISDRLPRRLRHTQGAWIQLIDRRESRVLAEWRLGNTGGIKDLRLLDEYDYAHWQTPFQSLVGDLGERAFHQADPRG